MASFSPRPTPSNQLDRLVRQFQEQVSTPKPRLVSVPSKQSREPRLPTSTKNILSPPNPPRRRLSTEVANHSPEHTFLEQFVRQVSQQKKQINVIRKENLKENCKQHQQLMNKPVMDIVDWIKMKAPAQQLGLNTMEFNKEHEALERLINRNQQAIYSLVQNRKELMEICMTKELKKLG